MLSKFDNYPSNSLALEVNLNSFSLKSTYDKKNPFLRDLANRAQEVLTPSIYGESRNSRKPQTITAEAYFEDIEEVLCEKIAQYPVVLGCVAWLTNEKILQALATRQRVQLVVQNESYFQRNLDDWMTAKIERLYRQLPVGVTTSGEIWGDLINALNISESWQSAPVRLVGEVSQNMLNIPRMHNKFLIFGEFRQLDDASFMHGDAFCFCEEDEGQHGYAAFRAKGLWTGSFNFTKNATRSLENALYIEEVQKEGRRDDRIRERDSILDVYYQEWQRIFSISQGLPVKFWPQYNAPESFNLIF